MRKIWLWIIAAAMAAAGLMIGSVRALGAENAFYIETSDDGRMWTVIQEPPIGETEPGLYVCWYKLGTRCLLDSADISSAIFGLRDLEEGEHYYRYDRTGKVPVGEWRVTDPYVYCISMKTELAGNDCGIREGSPDACQQPFFSGWTAHCADCGDSILRGHVYMSYEAAKSIHVLDVDKGYYFLCPCMRPVWEETESGRAVTHYVRCGHLNRCWGPRPHKCKAISYNRYRVVYDANGEGAEGSMSPSFHMYNNGEFYEGKRVTPASTLSLCTYDRTAEGYVFAGWNTRPDGSGDFYGDGAEVLNLSSENYEENTDLGTVTLYAQWVQVHSALKIDAAGGSYGGENPVIRSWGSYLAPDASQLIPPKGYTAVFQAGGGRVDAPQITGTRSFAGWRLAEPAGGRLCSGVYYFTGGPGTVDTVEAVYALDPITLPVPRKAGQSFGGWYLDKECTRLAGYGGEPYILKGNATLYAKWVDLKLTAIPETSAGKKGGAVSLSWGQQDGRGKTYRIYRRAEGETGFEQIFSGEDERESSLLEISYGYEGGDRSYRIPSAGFYHLTAEGAQGGDSGKYTGGLGGRAEGVFYLEKGETISFWVGGRDGWGGGGIGSTFGSGGGRTVVSSDKKGVLLIAGGGGGATASCSGGRGGDVISYVAEGDGKGLDGMAGGGGGSVGGKAGTRIEHVHSVENGCYRDRSFDALSPDYAIAPVKNGWWDNEMDWQTGDYLRSDYYFSSRIGDAGNLIPVNGNKFLDLGVWIQGEGINVIEGNTYVQVADQNGVPFFTASVQELRREWNRFAVSVVLPAGNGVYEGWPPIAHVDIHTEWGKSDPDSSIYDILENHTVTYPIFYEDGRARAAKVFLDENYQNPVFYGNYKDEYYPGNRLYDSDIVTRRGYGDRPILFAVRSSWYGKSGAHFRHRISIPEGTTGIYVYSEGKMDTLLYHLGDKIKKPIQDCVIRYDRLSLSGGVMLDCRAMDIDIPSEGGSSFVNREYALSSSVEGGAKSGDGSASIRAELTGFTQEMGMESVEARDKAAPYAVDAGTVTMAAAGRDRILIQFGEVQDRGTRYYFRAESYSALTGEKICDSNIAECQVKSGIREYWWLIDSDSDTELAGHGQEEKAYGVLLSEDRRLEVEIDGREKYLHIAAIDHAGNVSDTVHLRLAAEEAEVAWDVSTEKVRISSIVSDVDYRNVYPAGEDTYYVKADGRSPFLLSFRSYMHGTPRADYQITHQIYDLRTEGQTQRQTQRLGVLLPCSEKPFYEEVLAAQQLRQWTEGASLLADASYSEAVRSQGAGEVYIGRGFTMLSSQNGKTVTVVPVAGAAYGDSVRYSEWNEDAAHGIRLVGDGEGPVITGLERLAEWELIDKNHQEAVLEVRAEDSLSGVRDFYLEIKNRDNYLERRFLPQQDGAVRISLTETDPIFSGSFIIAAYAEDNVGNIVTEESEVTEFALTADVTRILTPHDPIFKRGESGILKIEAWGYAEKVEVVFPDFLSGYNRIFLYAEVPQYRKTEEIQFMIPLDAPEDVYEIIVRAYKGDKKLEAHPAISTLEVDGSVLDELRTRLR